MYYYIVNNNNNNIVIRVFEPSAEAETFTIDFYYVINLGTGFWSYRCHFFVSVFDAETAVCFFLQFILGSKT